MDESSASAQPTQPTQPVAPTQPVEPVQPAEPVQPVAPVQPVEVAQPVAGPAPTTEKKKTGLIIGIIAAVLVLGGAAAIAFLNPFSSGGQGDRVPKAIAGLIKGDLPNAVGLNGSVTLNSTSSESPVSGITIDFEAGVDRTTLANATSANVKVVFTNENAISFKADEIHTKDGDLYLKLSGLADAIDEYQNNNSLNVVDCDADDAFIDCMPSSDSLDEIFTTLDSLGVIDVIDDEWILISMNDFSNVTDLTELDTPAQCAIDALRTLGDYSDDLANDYNANPFITYSTENLEIAKKKNELYRLTIDADKLAGFANAMSNSGFVNELYACTGETATNSEVDADDLAEIAGALPATYVEIDGNNRFTRVYLKAEDSEKGFTAVADIDITYSDSITLEEPEDYIKLSDVVSKVLTYFYGGVMPYDYDIIEE